MFRGTAPRSVHVTAGLQGGDMFNFSIFHFFLRNKPELFSFRFHSVLIIVNCDAQRPVLHCASKATCTHTRTQGLTVVVGEESIFFQAVRADFPGIICPQRARLVISQPKGHC